LPEELTAEVDAIISSVGIQMIVPTQQGLIEIDTFILIQKAIISTLLHLERKNRPEFAENRREMLK
jgi:hypothetical protein